MATRNLPGSEASRHGAGDADLAIMLGAHAAFRHGGRAQGDRPAAGGGGRGGVGFKIAGRSGLSQAGEMFAWIADGADPDQATAVAGTLPPPARLIYRAVWRPRYQRTSRW